MKMPLRLMDTFNLRFKQNLQDKLSVNGSLNWYGNIYCKDQKEGIREDSNGGRGEAVRNGKDISPPV